MIVEGIEREHLRYIVDHLRPDDHRELRATLWDDVDLVEHVMAHQSVSFTGFDRAGKPCGVAGLHIISPGVAQAWLFGTDTIRDLRIAMTRTARQVIESALEGRLIHRVQAASAAFYIDAHDWLQTIGLKDQVVPLRQYGRNREDFYLFAKLQEAV